MQHHKQLLPLLPVQTQRAPNAVGPYSQAIVSQGLVFVSGIIPIDPETNALSLFDGNIEKQTELVLSNLLAILEAAGCTKQSVIKTTIMLTDLSVFPQVNTVYGEFFGDHKPARSTFAVAALPKGANIEIDAIAAL